MSLACNPAVKGDNKTDGKGFLDQGDARRPLMNPYSNEKKRGGGGGFGLRFGWG